MRWEFIVALLLAVPVVVFPAALVWYLNGGALYRRIRRSVCRRLGRKETTGMARVRSAAAERDLVTGAESDEDGSR